MNIKKRCPIKIIICVKLIKKQIYTKKVCQLKQLYVKLKKNKFTYVLFDLTDCFDTILCFAVN